MLEVTYRARIEPLEEGGYGVSVPALPGCFTWGHTYEEAVKMAREAIEVYIESMLKQGQSLPVEPAQGPVTLGISVALPALA